MEQELGSDETTTGSPPQCVDDGSSPKEPDDDSLPKGPDDGSSPKGPDNGSLPKGPDNGSLPKEPDTDTTDNKLFLEVTSIITLISEICHNQKIRENVPIWKTVYASVYNHLSDEIADPVYPKLDTIMNGKQLYTCRSAIDKVDEIILNFGLDPEKSRLNELRTKLTILDDCPTPRFQELEGKVWTDCNRMTFGTADYHDMTILTGNIGVLTSLSDNDDFDFEDMKYIAHRPRCFVGKRYHKYC